jgi:uncharacterized protein YcbK (DUF882 family)
VPRPRLSPHFKSHEFDEHTGRRWPEEVRPQLELLCVRFLEPLRRLYGPVTITSGYRSELYNRRVGGASRSYHVWTADRQGVAVDLRCERGSPSEWAGSLAQMGPCGLSAYRSHVHVDSRGANVRW